MEIKEFCVGANEYNGATGIYYPNQPKGHKKYLFRGIEGYEEYGYEMNVLADHCTVTESAGTGIEGDL